MARATKRKAATKRRKAAKKTLPKQKTVKQKTVKEKTEKQVTRIAQLAFPYRIGDLVIVHQWADKDDPNLKERWLDGRVVGITTNGNYRVYVFAEDKFVNATRTRLLPRITQLPFEIGDYVTYGIGLEPPNRWGKIINFRNFIRRVQGENGEYDQEAVAYELLSTTGNRIWLDENDVWAPKIFRGLQPSCPICLEDFRDTAGISILVCGHLYCDDCALVASERRQIIGLNGLVIPVNQDLQPQEFKCGTCSRISTYPCPLLNLQYNADHNVTCPACRIEITDDMEIHNVGNEVRCCFCVPANEAQAAGYLKIYLPTDGL